MIASCGHTVEDPDDLHEMYELYTSEHGNMGISSGRFCKECFDKGIQEGYGYRTFEEAWDKLMEEQ